MGVTIDEILVGDPPEAWAGGRLHGRRRRHVPHRHGAGAPRRPRRRQAHPRLVAARRARRPAWPTAASTGCPPPRPTAAPADPADARQRRHLHRPRGAAVARPGPHHRRAGGDRRRAARRARHGHLRRPDAPGLLPAGRGDPRARSASPTAGRGRSRVLRPGHHRGRPRRRRRRCSASTSATPRTPCRTAAASPRSATASSACRWPPRSCRPSRRELGAAFRRRRRSAAGAARRPVLAAELGAAAAAGRRRARHRGRCERCGGSGHRGSSRRPQLGAVRQVHDPIVILPKQQR